MTVELPEAQVTILEAVDTTDAKSIDELGRETGVPVDVAAGAVFSLEEAGYVLVEIEEDETLELTAEGREYVSDGLPEQRLYDSALELGADEESITIDQVIGRAGISGPAVNIALSNYSRKGYGEIDQGKVTADQTKQEEPDREAALIGQLADGSLDVNEFSSDVLDQLERRGLIERRDSSVRWVTLTDQGTDVLAEGVEVTKSVDRLTPGMLTSGEWRSVSFTDYNVEADADIPLGGNTHILRQTAERVKDVLVGMGFSEMDGPHVDAQFWINDCLFMPQDHPARTHWDQFALDLPPIKQLPEDLVDRVKDAHLNGVGVDGVGYHSPWDESVARRLDLRGHTTSLSMRYLSGQHLGDLDPPERYFSVEKVYRNDTLDPTHLLEFFQIEGWVMAHDLSVRDLMGTFTEFYRHFGIHDLEFKPHYNPYTEPSFELFGRHPETDELIEIGNSGMFRDEVLRPLGVECDVMAWGLALERLLMLMYGFDDIRSVHGTLCDLELLRETEVLY